MTTQTCHGQPSLLDEWLAELSQAVVMQDDVDESISAEKVEALGFLNWLEPLVAKARPRFRQAIGPTVARRPDLLDTVEAFESVWLPLLARRLSAVVVRTCALELNVARLQDQLTGETPQERFTSFLRRLRRPEVALALLQEYPVLARRIDICLGQWHAAGVELAERLASDAQTIQADFFPAGAPGRIVEIETNVGDQHRDGRSVLILHFDSGARLVYKPRPLAVDAAFARLVEWLNAHGAQPALRPMRVLDRGLYGWAEFVPSEPCTSRKEVERFYTRQGMYLALFTALSAADLHYENLIAHGEHPVFVDLEALFYRRLPESSQEPGRKALLDSVLGMRLLPHQQFYEGTEAAFDVSALGAASGRGSSYTIVDWQGSGTDEMGLGPKSRIFPAGKHRPRLPDGDVSLADYESAVIEGFRAMYALLQHERAALVAPMGPITAFAGCPVRFLPRPTQAYAILNTQALHPDHLRDEADQLRIQDRLQAKAEKFPSLLRLIPAERADLDRGDVPLFTSRPDSLDVWTCGGEQIESFFARRSLDIVRERLRSMNADDLLRQLWLIEASFASVSGSAERLGRFQLGDFAELACEADVLIEERRALDAGGHLAGGSLWPARVALLLAHARRLRQLAWENEHGAGWISLAVQGGGWELATVRSNGRSGLAAIASFLLKLERLSGDHACGDFGRKAICNLRRRLAEESHELDASEANGLQVLASTLLGSDSTVRT